MREGFVVRSGGSYEFVHDRVHEAAYSLIPEEDRAKVHLQIGRLLIAAMPADKITERIFNLVNQFNRGAALISDPNEKQRVAELNLLAARRARASTAYAAACIYASAGMACWAGKLGKPLRARVRPVAAARGMRVPVRKFRASRRASSRSCSERAASKADKAACLSPEDRSAHHQIRAHEGGRHGAGVSAAVRYPALRASHLGAGAGLNTRRCGKPWANDPSRA